MNSILAFLHNIQCTIWIPNLTSIQLLQVKDLSIMTTCLNIYTYESHSLLNNTTQINPQSIEVTYHIQQTSTGHKLTSRISQDTGPSVYTTFDLQINANHATLAATAYSIFVLLHYIATCFKNRLSTQKIRINLATKLAK
jgi:hypothetical protein